MHQEFIKTKKFK